MSKQGQVGLFMPHVAGMTQAKKVIPDACRLIVGKEARRNNMMDIQRSAKRGLSDATVSTPILLFTPHLLTEYVPSFPVWRPSTFPRRIVFQCPMLRFPLPKAGTVTKELLLPALFATAFLPCSDGVDGSAKCTRNRNHCRPIFPSNRQIVARSTCRRTKIYGSISHPMRLHRQRDATRTTGRFHALFLRGRIVQGDKFCTALHRAKPSVFGGFVDKVRLNQDLLPTADTRYRDALLTGHNSTFALKTLNV